MAGREQGLREEEHSRPNDGQRAGIRLVVGLRSNTSEEHQKKLTRKNAEHHRIETMTFDDLLDRAKQYLENLRQL